MSVNYQYHSDKDGIYRYQLSGDLDDAHSLRATDRTEADTMIQDYIQQKENLIAAKPLNDAKEARIKLLQKWAGSNFIDTGHTGYEMPVSREDRQSLNEYESQKKKAFAKGDINEATPLPILTLNMGVQTLTLAELEDFNYRYGAEIEARTFTVPVKTAEINACTTAAEVEAVTW